MEEPKLENFSLLEGDGGGDNNHNNRHRNGKQRRIRKWGPRGIARRIRGQGIPNNTVPEVQESLLTSNGGFHDAPSPLSSPTKPINELSSDDDDDDEYYVEDGEYGDSEEEESGDDEEIDDDDDGSEGDDNDDNDQESESERAKGLHESASELGHYEDRQYDDGSSGYRDGEYRQDRGSTRPKAGGRPNRMLRGLQRSFSDRGQGGYNDRERDPKFDSYWNPNSSVSGRIEGFGSTAPDYTNPRTLREILKAFKERRIAARGGLGMQKMQVGGEDGSGSRSWRDRLDQVVDALVDAAIPTPELEGYRTSTARVVTKPGAKPAEKTKDNSKMSFLRREFGDDNAYIVYLEGEMVASELEVASYKARIKELVVEVKKLNGIDDGDDNSSADSSDASVKDSKESEIEWETGVPEEGILIDVDNNGSEKKSNGEAVSKENDDTVLSAINETDAHESAANVERNETENENESASSSGESESSDDASEEENDEPQEGDLIDMNAEGSVEGTLLDLTEQEEAMETVNEILLDTDAENTNGGEKPREDAVMYLIEEQEIEEKPSKVIGDSKQRHRNPMIDSGENKGQNTDSATNSMEDTLKHIHPEQEGAKLEVVSNDETEEAKTENLEPNDEESPSKEEIPKAQPDT